LVGVGELNQPRLQYILRMEEAAAPSESLSLYHAARHHNAQDPNLEIHILENLRWCAYTQLVMSFTNR